MGKNRMLKLVRAQRGVATVEFALISLPLLMLILGGIEFGFMMFSRARLEGVVRAAARMATTGSSDNGANGANIDAYVRDNLHLYGNTRVDITKASYAQYDQVAQPEKVTSGTVGQAPYCWTDVNGNKSYDKDPGETGLGGPNDIIEYKVKVTYPAIFPLIVHTVLGTDDISLESEATVQNEPFNATPQTQPKTCCMAATSGNPVTCS